MTKQEYQIGSHVHAMANSKTAARESAERIAGEMIDQVAQGMRHGFGCPGSGDTGWIVFYDIGCGWSYTWLGRQHVICSGMRDQAAAIYRVATAQAQKAADNGTDLERIQTWLAELLGASQAIVECADLRRRQAWQARYQTAREAGMTDDQAYTAAGSL